MVASPDSFYKYYPSP